MANESPIAVITGDILATKGEFQSVLADQSINFEREAEFALQILESSDYALKIAMGNRASVVNAVKNIAAIGISLNPAKKQAYLVPRRPKAGQPIAICLDISYRGLIDLAVDSGAVRWAQVKLVREHDTYESQGVDVAPLHKYAAFKPAERGQVIGVYSVVKTIDGDFLTHEMSIDEVFDIRDRSESWKAHVADKAKKTPWVTDFGEMVKKTCIKQASKLWPRGSGRLEQAIHHLNVDGGEGLVDINSPPGYSESASAARDLSDEWIAKVNAAPTDKEAVHIWELGIEKLEKTRDVAAVNSFKAAVAARRGEFAAQAEKVQAHAKGGAK